MSTSSGSVTKDSSFETGAFGSDELGEAMGWSELLDSARAKSNDVLTDSANGLWKD